MSLIVDLANRGKPMFTLGGDSGPLRDADQQSQGTSEASSLDDVPDMVLAVMQEKADAGDLDMLAIMKKFNAKGRFAPRGASGARPSPPPRDKRDLKCANCGINGHVAADCRKIKLPFEKRKCHICQKEGHIARECPDKPDPRKREVNTISVAIGTRKTVHALCNDDEQDPSFHRVQAQRSLNRQRPRPRTAQLSDFMGPFEHINQWDIFTADIEDEDCHSEDTLVSRDEWPLPADEPGRLRMFHKKTLKGTGGAAKHQTQRMRRLVEKQDREAMDEAQRYNAQYENDVIAKHVVEGERDRGVSNRRSPACLDVERSDLSPVCATLPGGERSDLSPVGATDLTTACLGGEGSGPSPAHATQPDGERSDLSPACATYIESYEGLQGLQSKIDDIVSSNEVGDIVRSSNEIGDTVRSMNHGGDGLATGLHEPSDDFEIIDDDDNGSIMNDALRKAIQSTAKTPKEAMFLEQILRQVDIQQFQRSQDEEKCRAALDKCDGPCIPTPSISGHTLAPVSLFERETMDLLVNEAQEWEDIEFEVALDSGSIVNVCHPDDCPGYIISESPGSKCKHNFVVGNGGKLPNLGEWKLNLDAPASGGEINSVSSVFQVARVTRPLMSVGHICDQGLLVVFDKLHAIVRDGENNEICRFTRGESGLYTAKMKLKAPFGRQE